MSLAPLLLLATAAAVPPPAAQGPIRAARTPEAPKLDGRPDDPVWQLAPPYTQFLEQYPDEGRAPGPEFRTEVRVLHDDRTLYILVVCHDPQPELVQRQLGRRDTPLVGDQVEIGIDSTHDRRSGYYFGVNAAGVLRDGLFYGDVNLADTWDAVWDAAVAPLPDGWSAEFAIPLDFLRFPRAPTQEWGFLVRRTIHRTHQVFDSIARAEERERARVSLRHADRSRRPRARITPSRSRPTRPPGSSSGRSTRTRCTPRPGWSSPRPTWAPICAWG